MERWKDGRMERWKNGRMRQWRKNIKLREPKGKALLRSAGLKKLYTDLREERMEMANEDSGIDAK